MDKADQTALDRWKESRAGAWSGRGFHYQHLFVTLLLVRQWAGLLPSGSVVPEGFDDCVVELPEREVWIQIKSRQRGAFGHDLDTIFATSAAADFRVGLEDVDGDFSAMAVSALERHVWGTEPGLIRLAG